MKKKNIGKVNMGKGVNTYITLPDDAEIHDYLRLSFLWVATAEGGYYWRDVVDGVTREMERKHKAMEDLKDYFLKKRTP